MKPLIAKEKLPHVFHHGGGSSARNEQKRAKRERLQGSRHSVAAPYQRSLHGRCLRQLATGQEVIGFGLYHGDVQETVEKKQ